MKKIILALFCSLLLFISTNHAWASPVFDKIIQDSEIHNNDIELLGDNLTIESGGTVNGNVAILGGYADIRGTINGDVSIAGGNVFFAGTINGDIVIFGGNLQFEEMAQLDGECALIGGNIENTKNTNISCSNISNRVTTSILQDFSGVSLLTLDNASSITKQNLWGQLGSLLGWTIILAIFAWGIAAIWPNRLKNMIHAISHRPFASGAVGILTTGAFTSIISILSLIFTLLLIVCIGLLGFPILFILLASFAIVSLFGWVSIGYIVGNRMKIQLCLSQKEIINTTVTGTLFLTFTLGLLNVLPSYYGSAFFAKIFTWIVIFVGIGAATLTRLGQQPYPISQLVLDSNSKTKKVTKTRMC